MRKKTSFKRKTQEESPKQKPISVSKPFITNLPQDIITVVLSFLPVKSLIIFTCVCKSWQYLISNTKFIKTHLSKSRLSKNKHKNQRVIFSYFGESGGAPLPCYVVKSFSLDTNVESSSSSAVFLDYPTRGPYRYWPVSIVGSCDGLVCLVIENVGFYIWNPCTKISKVLPDSGIQFRQNILTCYGFGYDKLNDDYKIVLTICSVDMGKKVVNVYSLKSNLWRKIGEFPHQNQHRGDTLDFGGKYVDGVLHWALTHVGIKELSKVIASFDLGNETFGEIELPWDGDCNVSFMSLGVLQGCLSIYCHVDKHDDNNYVDIWVMKDYGVRDTWTKLYTTSYKTKKMYFEYTCCFPLCIFKTGEMLLIRGFRLFVYNPKNGRFRHPNVENLSRRLTYLQATTYVESLVSPNIFDEVPGAQH